MEVLMPLQMAFGITVRDVRAVLVKHAEKIVGRSELSVDAFAASLYYSFSEEEMDDIALAAMDAFLEDKPEVDGAHRAIRKLLIRRGVWMFLVVRLPRKPPDPGLQPGPGCQLLQK